MRYHTNVRAQWFLIMAITGALLAAPGCTKQEFPGRVDPPALARGLIEHNRSAMLGFPIPTTDREWASVRLKFLPGGIMLWWCPEGKPNHEMGPYLFHADGRFITVASYCEVADVTGDGATDFIVIEHRPDRHGYWYSVYPLGGNLEPFRGFAEALYDYVGFTEPLRLTDFNRDGIPEIVVTLPTESLAGKGWVDEGAWEAWEARRQVMGEGKPTLATAVWSFKQGTARPILIFAGGYASRILPNDGFVIAREPFGKSPGIPVRPLSVEGPSWFEVLLDQETGLFVIPEEHRKEGPFFLLNRQIVNME